MFADFVLEADYTGLKDLGTVFVNWVRIVGVMAMATLLLWELFRLVRGSGSSITCGLSGRFRDLPEDQVWKIRSYRLFLALTGLSLAVMAGFLGWGVIQGSAASMQRWILTAFTFACGFAVLAISWEFLIDLPRLSFRRIWAIGLFSIREAIRRKVLWSFLLVLIVFLFASWFIKADRPENQWRTYTNLVFFLMAGLILLTSGVIACFSLPTDIRQQTIHTVVTKPVQKIEILLGRMVGIIVLMTVILLVVAHLSLLYVFRGIAQEYRDDVMRARVRYGGALRFEELDLNGNWVQRRQQFSVGREWEYRQYIRGGSTQEAVFRFVNPPRHLPSKDRVGVEFGFDIFRTSKGGEYYREGVSCRFTFVNTAKWEPGRYDEYREGRDPATGQQLSDEALARRFGYYELPARPTVVDYQTYRVSFPGAVLEDLGDADFEIRVSCTTPGQYLGMAEPDLYVLADEGNFYLNFLKGAAGIWFLMALVVTLGVVFSTHLSSLVDLMLTTLLVGCGAPKLRSFLITLTNPSDPDLNPGGGPGEAVYRLFNREGLLTPVEKTKAYWVIERFDDLSQVFFRGFVSIVPDLYQFDRSMFVAEGFNIPNSSLLMNLIMLVAYLFPFVLAGYYLMNAREVAGAT
jgi:hypothetical protein